MPIANGDDLIAGLTAGPRLRFVKASQTTEGAGTFHSLWKAAGGPPAGANPPAFNAGSGYTPTKDTTGAIPFSNPASPALSYLGRMAVRIAVAGELIVCDRLWACSGFATNSTSTQTVTTPGNLPSGRDPNAGADVEPWIEVYTAPGATGATWTMTGTDSAGNTGRTWAYTHPANAESVGQMLQLLPGGASPASTVGCRQVTSFACSVSSGTAGDVGVTLLRELGSVVCELANVKRVQDYAQLGLPRVYDDACLMMRIYASAGTTGLMMGDCNVAQA